MKATVEVIEPASPLQSGVARFDFKWERGEVSGVDVAFRDDETLLEALERAVSLMRSQADVFKR